MIIESKEAPDAARGSSGDQPHDGASVGLMQPAPWTIQRRRRETAKDAKSETIMCSIYGRRLESATGTPGAPFAMSLQEKTAWVSMES
jgi:hypothetical protein